MNSFLIRINQNPLSQGRPRVTRWVTYDPNKDKKTWIKHQISEQFAERLSCPISVELEFFMPIPKSASKKKQKEMSDQKIIHTKKPDIDNLIKTYLDCMNDLVYKDDSQIYSLSAYKYYSNDPRIEIEIRWKNIR